MCVCVRACVYVHACACTCMHVCVCVIVLPVSVFTVHCMFINCVIVTQATHIPCLTIGQTGAAATFEELVEKHLRQEQVSLT